MINSIKNKGRWPGLIALMLFIACSAAIADDINFKVEVPDSTIKNETGATLVSGTIQVIQKGNVIETGAVANGGYIFQKKIPIASGDVFQLKVMWNSADGATSYYKKSSTYTWTPGSPPPPLYTWATPYFGTYYIASKPNAPSIGNITISYTEDLSPKSTIPIIADTAHHEVGNYHIKIREYPSKTIKVDKDCASTYTTLVGELALNTTYSTEAYCGNAFGNSDASAIKGFQIKGPAQPGKASDLKIKLNADQSVTLSWNHKDATDFTVYESTDDGKTWLEVTGLTIAGDVTKSTTINPAPAKAFYKVRAKNASFAEEVVGKITFALKKVIDKTGLNSIAIPFDTNAVSVVGPKVPMNAQGVAESIGGAFESLGEWNEEAQTSNGFVKITTAPPSYVGVNFDIIKNLGYQVSVSKDTNWTVVGQVSGKI